MSKKNLSEKEFKYVCFETCLISGIDKQINDIFNYSIVKYSISNIKLSKEEILNEAIRLYYDDKLPGKISNVFATAFDGEVEESTRGYNEKGEFDPSEERTSLLLYFDSEDEGIFDANFSKFIDDCKPYCQLHRGLHALNLTGGNYDYMLKGYSKVNNIVAQNESQYGKNPLVMMKIQMLLDYVNGDKTHRNFELLKGFLAIKSIQGQKDFTGTNKEMVCARMIGAKTPDIAKQLIKDKAINKVFLKYKARYFFDQLLLELQIKSFITAKITYGRSVYLSTQLDNELLCVAIMNFTEKKLLNTASIKLKNEEKEYRNRIANNLINNNLH